MHTPMWFFDTTPVGRILNRFTKDLDIIDLVASSSFRQSCSSLGRLVVTFVLVALGAPSPYLLAALGAHTRTTVELTLLYPWWLRNSLGFIRVYCSKIGLIVVVYGLILWFYLPTSRQLCRLEALARSNLFAHITESVHGTSPFTLGVRFSSLTSRLLIQLLDYK